MGPIIEAIGLAGMFVGAVMTAPSHAWLAGVLTLATPIFALAALRRDRALRIRRGRGGGTALGATWAWLAVARVTVVEAYTLPAAAVALEQDSSRGGSNRRAVRGSRSVPRS